MHDARERELPYAWVIVGLAFFALALAMGIRSTLGLLVHPWEREFGWDRAAVSLTASVGFLVYGLAQPVAGRWADRYGPRLVFAVAFGIVDFATVPPTTALSTSLFGRRSGGTVVGLVSLSHQIGSAVGSYAGGLVHDVAGSYVTFFLGAGLFCLAAAMSWGIVEAPAVEAAPAPA